MRAFFISILALAFALSTHAAVLDKRAISAPVQLCINDLKSISDKLTALKSTIDASLPVLSDSSYFYIFLNTSNLHIAIEPANTNCCVISGAVVAEESDAFTGAIEAELSQSIAAYNAHIAMRPSVTSIVWKNSYKYSTNKATAHYATLNNCLVAKTPYDKLASVNALVAQFNAAAVTLTDAYAT